MIKSDLHLHSFYSDGILSPASIITHAIKNSFKVISITDHDSMKAYENLTPYQVPGLHIIPGIELHSELNGIEYHILGYFINPKDTTLKKILTNLKENRIIRAKNIIKKLNKLNINIEFSDIEQMNNDTAIGRPHIAHVLVKNNYVKNIQHAFDKYLGKNMPAYVPHNKFTPFEIISILKENKAIPVWAHPYFSNNNSILDEFIEAGLQGIESFHAMHSIETQKHYFSLAKNKKIISTGGTDWHGEENYTWDFEIPKYCLIDLYKAKGVVYND